MKTPRCYPWFIRALLLLLLALSAACRQSPPVVENPGPPTPSAIEPSPIAATTAPTATPDLAAAIVGRWRQEVAEEGLSYITVIEFFADGLFSATVNGVFSPCLILPDFCGLLPDEMPLGLTYTGRYEFIAAARVRLDIEEPVDPMSGSFLPQFNQRLEAFAVDRPDAETLILEQDGRTFIYQLVR